MRSVKAFVCHLRDWILIEPITLCRLFGHKRRSIKGNNGMFHYCTNCGEALK